jgi:hypothetical protein
LRYLRHKCTFLEFFLLTIPNILQNYKNHVRYNPLHHFILSPLTLIIFIVAVTGWFQDGGSLFNILVAIGLLLTVLIARLYAMKVQDRVIRLEMRQRYFEITSKRFKEVESVLNLRQIIALRFADDEELLILIEKVIKDNLTPKQIKQEIKNWVPDNNRV